MERLADSRRHIGLVALLAALCAVLALAPASSAAGARSVKVRLVIEGIADSAKSVNLNGVIGLCEEQVEGRFEDETTYLRGRGVTLELRRRRSGRAWQYTVNRVGHSSAEFTVAAVRKRAASGTADSGTSLTCWATARNRNTTSRKPPAAGPGGSHTMMSG